MSAPQAETVAVPISARDRIGAVWRMLPLFFRFGSVGLAGFVVDTGVVYGTRHWIGLYAAGCLSYVLAASCNWWLNRRWTFRDRPRQPAGRQWLVFLTASLPGLVFNRGAYFALVYASPMCHRHPILAIVVGSVAGMCANFGMANLVVFAA